MQRDMNVLTESVNRTRQVVNQMASTKSLAVGTLAATRAANKCIPNNLTKEKLKAMVKMK
jgi:hypothetical protein